MNSKLMNFWNLRIRPYIKEVLILLAGILIFNFFIVMCRHASRDIVSLWFGGSFCIPIIFWEWYNSTKDFRIFKKQHRFMDVFYTTEKDVFPFFAMNRNFEGSLFIRFFTGETVGLLNTDLLRKGFPEIKDLTDDDHEKIWNWILAHKEEVIEYTKTLNLF